MNDDMLARVELAVTDLLGRVGNEVRHDLSTFMSRYADNHCKSEIEKLFLISWSMRLRFYQLCGSQHGGSSMIWNAPTIADLDDDVHLRFEDEVHHDLLIPQMRVGPYVADFGLRRIIRGFDSSLDPIVIKSPKVIVECDGHEFHERTKAQAQHDKERDRLLQASGFYVLRFTGSELWKSPASCARQVDEFLDEHIERAADGETVAAVGS